MLLLLAFLCVAAAVYLAGEAVTYPARLKYRSIRRASDYGRVRVPAKDGERLRFSERVLSPAVGRLASIPLKLNPRTNVDLISARLVAAGLAPRVSAKAFLAAKGGTTIAAALLGLGLGALTSVVGAVLLVPIFGITGFLGPDVFLTARLRSRREAIRAELPDALDLLAVSVEAGLGFDGAVTKLTEHMEGALVQEFSLTLNQIRIGEARPVALKKLAERVNAPELSSFVRAVIQADQLGISLGRILRVQAADARNRRQAAAEEKAMKAPIKMLFPTVLFIFPAMFIVVLGPALLNILAVLK
jgi:tight adherence protein C